MKRVLSIFVALLLMAMTLSLIGCPDAAMAPKEPTAAEMKAAAQKADDKRAAEATPAAPAAEATPAAPPAK